MLERYFGIRRKGSTLFKEIIAGCTTFFAMAYILAVNPGILEAAGIPREATVIATCLVSALGTLLMGFYARRPLAIAPYMGENAFIAICVCGTLGYSWQQALAAVFAGGVLFLLLTVLGLRSYLANAIPSVLRFSFVVGIGLFIAFVGLEKMGVVAGGATGGPPVALGNLNSLETLLGIGGFILMGLFLLWRFPFGIFFTIVLSYACGIFIEYGAGIDLAQVMLPDHYFSAPDFAALTETASLWPLTKWQLDLSAFTAISFVFAVFVPIFLMDFFDTIGTLIGVSDRAGFLDENGNLPEIEKPMLCDAVASIAAALFGTTTTGTYIESATGIEAGGRSGMAAVVTGFLFLLSLFFVPLLQHVPEFAYTPALVIVGLFMMQSVKKINFEDVSELVPAFAVIVLIPLTYNIGVGMAAGFVLYPVFKTFCGRYYELTFGSLLFAAASCIFFVFYPYEGESGLWDLALVCFRFFV